MLNLQKLEKIFLFLTVLFLPTQLGKHFWPDFSFVYSLPIDYLSPVIYFWDLLVMFLLAVFILQRKKINRLALNLFLLFILTSSLSLMPTGFVRLEQYLIAGLFGVYIASINIKNYLSIFFVSTSLALIFESLLSFGQFFSGHTLGFWLLGERTFFISTPAIAKFDFRGLQFLRPYGTFPHPNVLAGFMVISVLVLFLLKKKVNYIYWLAITTVLLTASRVAMTAGFFASIIFLPKKYLIWFLFAVGVISPFLYIRFSSLFNFDSLAFFRREDLAGIALNLFSRSPLTGIGINNFIPSGADQVLVGPSRFLQPVHNIFLLQLSETGILGLIGLLVLIGIPFVRNKTMRVVWIVIIFLGMFDHYFLTLPQGYRLLFLVWGLSFSVLKYSGEKYF